MGVSQHRRSPVLSVCIGRAILPKQTTTVAARFGERLRKVPLHQRLLLPHDWPQHRRQDFRPRRAIQANWMQRTLATKPHALMQQHFPQQWPTARTGRDCNHNTKYRGSKTFSRPVGPEPAKNKNQGNQGRPPETQTTTVSKITKISKSSDISLGRRFTTPIRYHRLGGRSAAHRK